MGCPLEPWLKKKVGSWRKRKKRINLHLSLPSNQSLLQPLKSRLYQSNNLLLRKMKRKAAAVMRARMDKLKTSSAEVVLKAHQKLQ